MKQQWKGIACVVAASFGFGVMPALALNAYDGGISVMTMLSLKYVMVCALMLPVAFIKQKLHRLPRAQLLKIFLVSATLYTAQAVLYAWAVTLIPVALAALILFTYPILVSVLGAVFFRQRLGLRDALWLAAALVGLVLMFARPMGAVNPWGVAAAALASLSYAVYVLLMGRLTVGVKPFSTNAILNSGAAVTVVAVSLLTGQFSLDFTPVTWLYVLYNAVFVGIIAFWLWLVGLQALGSVRASVLSMSEPVFACLASFVLRGQQLGVAELVGGGVLLAAVSMFVYGQQKRMQPSAEKQEKSAQTGASNIKS